MEGERGKNSEALEDVEEETRVHHSRSILDQNSLLPLETRHPAWGRGKGCWDEITGCLFLLLGHPKNIQMG